MKMGPAAGSFTANPPWWLILGSRLKSLPSDHLTAPAPTSQAGGATPLRSDVSKMDFLSLEDRYGINSTSLGGGGGWWGGSETLEVLAQSRPQRARYAITWSNIPVTDQGFDWPLASTASSAHLAPRTVLMHPRLRREAGGGGAEDCSNQQPG